MLLLKPTFIPTFQLPPRIPIQLPQIPFVILPAIQLHPAYKPSPHTPTNNHLPSATIANNVPHCKLSNNPTQSRAKHPISTSTTKPRVFPTSHQFPNLRNYTHHHRRFQPEFRKQEAKARALSPSQSCSG
jgi:hypothetical protein